MSSADKKTWTTSKLRAFTGTRAEERVLPAAGSRVQAVRGTGRGARTRVDSSPAVAKVQADTKPRRAELRPNVDVEVGCAPAGAEEAEVEMMGALLDT